MSGTILNGIIYLINTIFNIYIFILIIRLVLAWIGTTSQHPVVMFIVSVTSPIIKPLRQYIPDVRGFETATFLLILLLEIIKYLIIISLAFGFPNILGLLIIAFTDTLNLFSVVFFYTLLFYFFIAIAILTLLGVKIESNQLWDVLVSFNSIILQPFQRIIPPIKNIDLSPVVVAILLGLFQTVIVPKLMSVGMGIAILG